MGLAAMLGLPAVSIAAVQVPGTISGAAAVTSTGSASYQLDFPVPAGQNGLKPSVGLSYDSTGGDGPAGQGWAISGLSEIYRCDSTIATDGGFRGVRYDKADRYCLDGSPLIRITAGNYWSAGEYRTEIHDYEKIVAVDSVGSGEGTSPKYFEVHHRDGLIYRYGYTADSRVEAPDNADGAVRTWALDSIRDPYDLRVYYSYEEVGATGEFRPKEIRWTAQGESSAAARYRVWFQFEDRPAEAVRSGYEWGSIWTANKRLDYVSYQYDAGSGFSLVHRYDLSYADPAPGGTGRSHLASIQQCGPDECLPATSFTWTDGVAGWGSQQNGPSSSADNNEATFADYDGDGDTDILVPKNGTWQLMLAGPGGYGTPIDTGINQYGPAIPFEYNGDGRTDFLISSGISNTWIIRESTGTGSGTASFTARGGVSLPSSASQPRPIDFDGDGLHDLVYIEYDSGESRIFVRKNTGGSLAAAQDTGISSGYPYVMLPYEGALEPIDFDGDGRQDLIVKKDFSYPGFPTSGVNWFVVFLGNDTGFDGGHQLIPLTVSQANLTSIALEINGDGRTDLLIHDQGSGQWRPNISYGGQSPGGFATFIPSCPESITTAATDQVIAVDYDGDGRMDILRPNGAGWRVHRSDGQCFYNDPATYPDYVIDINTGVAPADVSAVNAVDSTGAGNDDLLFAKTNSTWKFWPHQAATGSASQPDLLAQVTDGLGNENTFLYSPLSTLASYTVDGSANEPSEQLIRGGADQVVYQQTTTDGLDAATWGGEFVTTYEYWNGVRNMLGRGFLGFAKVKTTDGRNGDNVYSETEYHQDFPYIGLPKTETSYQPGGAKISEHLITWDHDWTTAPNGDKYYFVHFIQSPSVATTTKEFEVDPDSAFNGSLVTTTTHTVTYDSVHGAVSLDVETVSSPAQSTTFTTSTAVTFWSPAGAQWCRGLPQRIDVEKSDTTASAKTRTIQYTYTPECRIATKRVGPASEQSQQLLSVFGYDSDGKLTSITQNDGDLSLPSRITTIGWATTGSDPAGYRRTSTTQVIDAPDTDLTTTQAWDYALGLVRTSTDPRGNTTTLVHDDFGRVIQETRPGPAISTLQYEDCRDVSVTCFPSTAIYRSHVDDATGRWSETYSDGYGRVVARATELIDGTESRQVIQYDQRGRTIADSRPYLVGAQVFSTSYEYDLRNRVKATDRPISEAVPSGSTTLWTYDRLTVTVVDANDGQTVSQYDAAGRLVGVADPVAATAAYAYWPHGELRTATTDSVIQLTYDDQGNPSTVDDPDSGLWTYKYNVFGELTERKDDKSPQNVMTQGYDQLGRLKNRIEPEGTSTWTYYQSGNGLGLLKTVTGPTGYEETYTYNPEGLPASVNAKIDALSHLTEYGYNSAGQVTSILYPTYPAYASFFARPQVSLAYTNGYLDTIHDVRAGNALVYDVQAQDAAGTPSVATFGSGQDAVDQQTIFDPATGRLKAIQTGTAPLGSSIQDYSYEWDQLGNLKQREDLNAGGLLESFNYDAANRLIDATVGTQITTIAYQPDANGYGNGNISNKSDVGTYSYAENGAGPHAVTSISGLRANTYHYDANGNMDCRGDSTAACANGDKITWFSFNKPDQIDYGADYARFFYAPDRRRVKQISKSASSIRTVRYVGGHFEWEQQGNTTRFRSTVFAGGRAIYTLQDHVTDDGCTVNTSSEAYFLFRDHQGSVDKVYGTATDPSYSFDAFGKRRNAADWTADTNDLLLDIDHQVKRGYTGHEHVDNVRLIHMNGRVQDPILGRMISPDPIMGDLRSPQRLNPYSYVVNNPLSLVDPSGFGIEDIQETIVTAYGDLPNVTSIAKRLPLQSISSANILGFTNFSYGSFGGGIGIGPGSVSNSVALLNSLFEYSRDRTRELQRASNKLRGRDKFCRGAANCAVIVVDRELAKALALAEAYLKSQSEQSARTEVSLGYTNTPVGVANHTLVIGTDPITGEQYATRAGPSLNRQGGCCLIYAEYGVYDSSFRDNPNDVHTLQYLGVLHVSLETFAARAIEFANVTNKNGLAYLGVTSNSNSYAFTFVESLGFSRPRPAVWAPGWQYGTPSPELSY